MSTTPLRPQECVHEETVSLTFESEHLPTSLPLFYVVFLKYSGHTIQHQCAFRLLQRDLRTVFMKKCWHNMAARQKEVFTLEMAKRDATTTRTLFQIIIHLVF